MTEGKNSKTFFTPLIVLTLLFSFSCQSENEQDISKYAHLYTDILIVQQHYANDADSLQIKKDSLFKAYKLSKSEYKQFFTNLKHDEKKWDEFFDSSLAIIDTLEKNVIQ